MQFNHRMVAYLLWTVAVLHAIDAFRSRGGPRRATARWRWRCLVTLQAGIGITTLLHQTPLHLALLHQLTGILVLTVAVIHAQRISANPAPAVSQAEPFTIPRSTA